MCHIAETIPNGPLKFLYLFYEALQLDISNPKSTGRLRLEKKKTLQTWQCMLDNQAITGPSNFKMNSHNEMVSQKSRRV